MTLDDAIESWRPLVKWLAADQKQLHRGYLFDERVQDGMIAVWRALRSYDPTKGASLDTWVSRKIRRYMLDGSIRESGRGGGGSTYGHVVYLQEIAMVGSDRHDPFGTETQDPYYIEIPALVTDPIEEAFEILDERDREERVARRVRSALRSVKNGDVVVARLDGRLLREIGDDLGITESGALLRWRRAVVELRKVLAPDEPVAEPKRVELRPVSPIDRERERGFWEWFEQQRRAVSA